MNLAHLEQNVRPLELAFAGETLHFSYRPAAVTPTFSAALGTEKQPLVWALSKTLLAWDLVEDADGAPLPLTEQRLLELPTAFLRKVLHAILDDVNVGEPFGATSKAG